MRLHASALVLNIVIGVVRIDVLGVLIDDVFDRLRYVVQVEVLLDVDEV